MRYFWLFFIPPIAIAIVIFAAWYRYRIHSNDRSLKRTAVIAHTKTIKLLPAYRKAMKQYRMLLIFTAAAFLLSVFSITAVAARPITRHEGENGNKNRDIVLCLDVSGSMDSYQKELLEFFAKIAGQLRGQRLGLTIFDGVPANLVPLTDDYDAVSELALDLSKNFDAYSSSVMGSRSSAIGDGVMGCISNLDKLDNERPKSIIVATDNYAGSGETVDINQAARYAKRYDITLYGISIGSASAYNVEEKLFQNAVLLTGGSFYNVHNFSLEKNVTESIVRKILQQEAAKLDGSVEIAYNDSPDIMLIISAVCFAVFLFLIWRLKL
ncbi:MAG: VWA domain-containing protein [Candidatus Saccharibacteria bacterium]|nr:VWA domain-containing protein [Candidatus Saccharibacteria bacterium]